MTIKVADVCGPFAENKDQAREMREKLIAPALDAGEKITLDFTEVDSSTQSFMHALISRFFQENGEKALNKFEFKNCNPAIKSLVATVVNYSLE